MVVAAMRLGARWLLVLAGAIALVVLGHTMLRNYAAVRPMWTGPNTVVIAQKQAAAAAQAAAQMRQNISTLQVQTQQIVDQANQVSQWLQQVGATQQSGGFGFGGGGQ